jgi:processive 1,2-diacylglycerol beta-glucosyltransferase
MPGHRILILTASMGEGHNTAARNIRDAILAETNDTAEVLVVDPYTRTNPVINRLMQRGYATAINNYPKLWKSVFAALSHRGVIEGMAPILSQLTAAVSKLVADFRPTVIASTYPVFGYILGRIPGPRPPFFMVVTDSTMINQVWYRYGADGHIVADEPTASVLRNDGVPPEKIHTLGFPVGMAFEDFRPAPAPTSGAWRVLFFPGGSDARAIETLRLLAGIPAVHTTVVTGKRKRTHTVLEQAGLPAKGTLLGWTDDMPGLMGSHHLFIGKAGGATVQEAIAARLPFIVSHVVPGQEEGNIALIQQSAIGTLASQSPQHILHNVLGAMANRGSLWHAWRNNLEGLQKPPASRAIAQFLLERSTAA